MIPEQLKIPKKNFGEKYQTIEEILNSPTKSPLKISKIEKKSAETIKLLSQIFKILILTKGSKTSRNQKKNFISDKVILMMKARNVFASDLIQMIFY
jgi:hypothetical protein